MKGSARAVDFGRELTPDFRQDLIRMGTVPVMPAVGEPIEQSSRHPCIAKHADPLAEGEVGDHDDAGTLLQFAERVEEER